MRGSEPGGRFSIPSEIDRYLAGIDEDLQNPTGDDVQWWRYDKAGTKLDEIYDVGVGRHWRGPFPVPVISAHLTQGATFQTERGFYNADVLRLLINVRDLLRIFPHAELEVDEFLKDRVQFNGKTFRPSSAQLEGRVLNRWAIFKVDLIEVKEEEQYNDAELGSNPDQDDPYDAPAAPPAPAPDDPYDNAQPTPTDPEPTEPVVGDGTIPLTIPFIVAKTSVDAPQDDGTIPLTIPFTVADTTV